MAWFKKSDPISERERQLKKEIAALEVRIKTLDGKTRSGSQRPVEVASAVREATAPTANPAIAPGEGVAPRMMRSTVLPHSGPAAAATPAQARAPVAEPIFERVDRSQLKSPESERENRDLYNDFGVRRYDLPAFWRRLRNQFRGPSTSNPKLVSYLAAGGIQGLKPLRHEKRVARNQLIALVALLFLALLGIVLVFVNHR